MKTLYISDLDGTLLKSDATLSKFTASAVNSLTLAGMIFSYATARSYVSASRVCAGLSEKLPVIIFNGTFILDAGSGRVLLANEFTSPEAEEIIMSLTGGGVNPFVHFTVNNEEKFCYAEDKLSRGAAKFADERRDDKRRMAVEAVEEMPRVGVFHFTCIDEREKLEPLFETLKDRFECLFYLDPYSKEYWLEVQPKMATKANAVLQLKKLLGCERVVCFGDGINDISMFHAADECYAVANACAELKEIATDVILSNDDDGVAKWLIENYKK